MSDYVSNNMQEDEFASLLDDLDDADWNEVTQPLQREPWMSDSDWQILLSSVQGAQPAPEDSSNSPIRLKQFPLLVNPVPVSQAGALPFQQDATALPGVFEDGHSSMSTTSYHSTHVKTPICLHEGSLKPPSEEEIKQRHLLKPTLSCDFEGCKVKPFKRRSELERHQLKHNPKELYSCPAHGCDRVGNRGFYREDKLKDHIVAGHDDETLFSCEKCDKTLTRDLFPLHSWRFQELSMYRVCPMPRCSFRIHFYGRKNKHLDDLQHHLLEHDGKGRLNFRNSIAERGYDPLTGEVICPVCPEKPRFAKHSDFHKHFFEKHFVGPAISFNALDLENLKFNPNLEIALKKATSIPDDVRQRRRTLLSLWPAFGSYPVWEDMKTCNRSVSA